MNILLSVDGSEYSLRAARFVLTHFNWFKDAPTLHVLHVEPAILPAHVTRHVSKEVVNDWYREQGEQALRPVLAELEAAGVQATVAKEVGEIAEQIARYADQHGCDLIVMGSHGRTGLTSLVMGSVASKVLATARQPVLLVR